MKYLIIVLLVIGQSATAGLFDKSKYGIGEESNLAKAILNNDLEPIKSFWIIAAAGASRLHDWEPL